MAESRWRCECSPATDPDHLVLSRLECLSCCIVLRSTARASRRVLDKLARSRDHCCFGLAIAGRLRRRLRQTHVARRVGTATPPAPLAQEFGASAAGVLRRVAEVGHLLRRDADVGFGVRAVPSHATRTHSEGVQWPSSRCYYHEAHTVRGCRCGGTRRHFELRRPLTPHTSWNIHGLNDRLPLERL